MTEANYDVALRLLLERFANPQRIAAAHMAKLVKILYEMPITLRDHIPKLIDMDLGQ